MKVTTVGLDLAKSVFTLHGMDERGDMCSAKQCLCHAIRQPELAPERRPCLSAISRDASIMPRF